MMLDLTNFYQEFNIGLYIKIIFLVMLGLFGIFSLMLANKIRSFNRILFLPIKSGGNLMQIIAFTYSIAIFVLFIIALIVL